MCNLNIHDRIVIYYANDTLLFVDSWDEISNKATYESRKVVIFLKQNVFHTFI